jgi:hypothetical protein
MFIRRFLLPSLTAIVFACSAMVASAQTGPVNGGGPKQGGAQNNQGQVLTAERVATMLNSKVIANPDGSKSVKAMITKDGWQFEVIVNFLPNGKVFDIYSPLTGANPNLTQAQVDGILKTNKALEKEQKFFTVNKQDSRLYFANINFRVEMNEQTFVQELNAHCMVIQNTYDLWKS